LLDMVDGKIRRTAEDEMTFEPDCPVVVAYHRSASSNVKAA
jgi:hypothetical protein